MRKFNSPSSGVTGRYCTDLDVNGDVNTSDGAVLEADNLHITADNADLTTNVKDLSGNVTGSISVTDKGNIAVTGTLTAGEDVSIKVDYLNAAKATGFSVAKEFVGTESASAYTFEVKYTQLFGASNETYGLSGSLAGVSYTVYDSDTNAKIGDKTVSADSTIEISAGQKAVFI